MDNSSLSSSSSLNISQPFNLMVFMSFFSPIILISLIVSLSFVFQNFKGFIYLGFLIGSLVLREFALKYSGSPIFNYDNTVCTSVQFSKYGNPTFNIFVFCFTIIYLCLPMIINNDINFLILGVLIFYSLFDFGIKYQKGCIGNTNTILIDSLSGLSLGALIVSLMYAGGSSKHLFFNEVSSTSEVCSVPSKQTFKCSVYKNGELVDHKTM
jgi:hypothetical protein